MPVGNIDISANPELRKEAVVQQMEDMKRDFKEREVFQFCKKNNLKYINLLTTSVNPDVFTVIPKEVSLKAEIVPFYRLGKLLRIAYSNTENKKTTLAIAALKKKFDVDENFCSNESLLYLQKHYDLLGKHKDEVIRAVVDESQEINLDEEIEKTQSLAEKMKGVKTDASLNMLHEAVLRLGVSDIHFQPEEKQVVIRARVDGFLREICLLPFSIANDLVQQIKHDASLKYNITNIPQDGKYSFLAYDRGIDVRVSTFPTNFGESVVLRFLDAKKGIVPLEKLGFSPRISKMFLRSITATNGMILVTGPTGSGKTTTLYSAISKINTPEKKILTLEDPIEFRLKGVLQAGINERAGFTFSAGLRSLLRQDPDVVLVGEIRDQETADAAVKASLTGHVVFSTLHTNSSVDAIPRLINMGVPQYVLAPSLRMIVAQRLIRKVCYNCTSPKEITPQEAEEINKVLPSMKKAGVNITFPKTLAKGKGCSICGQSGYRGETAALEILEISTAIQEQMFTDFSSQNIEKIARSEGFLTMWEEGMIKVIEGQTTLEELHRKVEQR